MSNSVKDITTLDNVVLPLPFDILYSVISHLPFSSLKAMSLVCHETRHESSKYLFHAVRISVHSGLAASPARKYLSSGCLFIMHPSRSRYIRHLHISVLCALGTRALRMQTLEFICDALERVKKLRSLSVNAVYGVDETLGRMMSERGKSIVPKLEEFETTGIAVEGALDGFWEAHEGITTYRATGFKVTPPPSRPLPNLHTVYLHAPSHSCIIRGSPVHSVTLTSFEERDGSATLVSNLRQSTVPITHLTLVLGTDYPLISNVYLTVIAHLPHLKYLNVSDRITNADGAGDDALSTLGRLAELEEFVWHGQVPHWVQEAFLQRTSSECLRLRKLTLERRVKKAAHHVGGESDDEVWVEDVHKYVEVFVREDASEAWRLVRTSLSGDLDSG